MAGYKGPVSGRVGVGVAAVVVEVGEGDVAVAAWVVVVADGGAGALGRQAAAKRLNVELVVAVDFLDDASADAEDLEHAGRGAAKDDDGEDDNDEDGGAQGVRVLAGEERGEGDADGAAQAGPEEHRLVVVGEDVVDLDAAPARAVPVEPVDGFGEREDGGVARRAHGADGDNDERRLEVERALGEER